VFVRTKRVGKYEYLQIVENWRDGKKTRQRVIGTLGRLDKIRVSGEIDVLLQSLGRFAEQVKVQEAYAEGHLRAIEAESVGPALVFGRLWEQLGLDRILGRLLKGRSFKFDVERAVFTTVLHRLFEAGSDRQAMRWKSSIWVPEAEEI